MLLSPLLLRYLAQQHETRAARELLTEAASDMEGVNFEKKGLLAQWQASLLGLQRRDEALQVNNHLQQQSAIGSWAQSQIQPASMLSKITVI